MKNNIKTQSFTCAAARSCSDVCGARVGARRGQGRGIGAHSPGGPSPPPAATWGHIMVRGWSVMIIMCHSPVCAPVCHGELDLAGPLPLEQQPGGGVELLVAHVGCLGELPGLRLDKLLVTIPEIIANFIKNDEILNKLISSGACTTSVIFCVFSK